MKREMNCVVCGTENLKDNWMRGVIKCTKCSHVYRDYPKINLHEYYSNIYRDFKNNKDNLQITVHNQRANFILSKVGEFINIDKPFFEVGFGYGYFYDSLIKKFPKIEYSCCEISKPLAEVNNMKGIDTLNCSFQDVPENNKKYDTIASFDVLEHFYDPKDYVDKLKKLLNIGGHAIIQVPTDRQIHFKNKFDGHYHYFSEQSLKYLLKKSFDNAMFYKTKPQETANGAEFLTVFRRVR